MQGKHDTFIPDDTEMTPADDHGISPSSDQKSPDVTLDFMSLTEAQICESVFEKLPSPLKSVAAEIGKYWNINIEAAILLVIQPAAVALGASVRISLPPGYPDFLLPGLNIAWCTETSSASHPFSVTAGQLIRDAKGKLADSYCSSAQDRRRILIQVLNKQDELARTQSYIPQCHLKAEISRLLQRAKPVIHTHSIDPAAILRAIAESFDSTVLSSNTIDDPADQLWKLGPASMGTFTSLLSQSWLAQSLEQLGHLFQSGTVNIAWQCQRRSLKRLYHHPNSPWVQRHPFLVVARMTVPEDLLRLVNASLWNCWWKLLRNLLLQRCDGLPSRDYCMSTEARTLFESFVPKIRNSIRLPMIEPVNWSHLIQGLALRYALFQECFCADEDTDGEDSVLRISAISMAKGCEFAWWVAHYHQTSLAWVFEAEDGKASGAVTSKHGQIYASQEVKVQSQILERLRKHGPMKRSKITLTFHRLRAQERDAAISELANRNLVLEFPDGVIQLKTSKSYPNKKIDANCGQ